MQTKYQQERQRGGGFRGERPYEVGPTRKEETRGKTRGSDRTFGQLSDRGGYYRIIRYVTQKEDPHDGEQQGTPASIRNPA